MEECVLNPLLNITGLLIAFLLDIYYSCVVTWGVIFAIKILDPNVHDTAQILFYGL